MKHTAQLKNSRITYVDEGSGAPVVLLHGFCGSSAYWEEVIPLLAGKFRVIAPDLRGHGDSSAPTPAAGDTAREAEAGGAAQDAYPMEAFALDVRELLDVLAIDKAILLGHSLGGYVTLAFAEAYPERLAAFGLIHSTAYPDTEEGKINRIAGIRTIREQGISVFVEGLVPKLFAPDHLNSMPDKVQRALAIGRGTDPGAAAATQEGMRRRPDRNAVLQDAQVPVLLVSGGQDKIVPTEKTFSVEGDGVTCTLLVSSGHMSMYEAPEQLAEAIKAFAAQIQG
ncbi:alpha/beta fold hydrolase [Gorillibacterium massiliense]|uniref:alpha/beta fold hydrolase n=1 Tax=Gorillibacterium massiliense TaxID=1280390 RepID=UPI0004B6A907|nr:alpha/beta hydrolase [Gorillibacterium massiliense]